MAELTNTTVHGARCDKPSCGEEIRGKPMSYFEGMRFYQDLAVDRGWTVWIGRSRRHYCPDHGPAPGYTMELLAGRPPGGESQ